MKLQRRLAVVAFLAVACGATAAHAQTLTLAYHQGDVYKYGLHAVLKTQITGAVSTPIALDVTAQETITVVSVDTSGNADVSVATSNLTVTSTMGTIKTTTSGLPGQTVTMTIARDGTVLKVDGQPFAGTGLSAVGGTSGSFISAVLPSHAVKPGDTWSKSYDIANPAGTGSVDVKADSKYLRDETIKAVSAAVVETKSTATFNLTIDLNQLIGGAGGLPGMTGAAGGPSDVSGPPTAEAGPQNITVTGTGSSDTTTWVDPSNHRIVKTHQTGTTNAKLTFQMAAGSTAPMLTPTAIDATYTLDLTPV
jgi:hypothetical protein